MVYRLFLVFILFALPVHAQQNDSRDLLLSTLWVQSSMEYSLITTDIFAEAQAHLKANKRSTSNAALEQDDRHLFKQLPPAVIVDLDETFLDNSAFQGYLIKNKQSYTQDLWNKWVQLQQATAVPGALNFARAVKSADIAIFYVTNRKCIAPENCPAKQATMENMRNLGFPDVSNPDAFLFNNERQDWVHDKTSRRHFISQSHRIIMMVGDDLNDFIAAEKVRALRSGDAELKSIAAKKMGREWFLLPNPMYGSWLQYLMNNGSDFEAALKQAPL